MVQERVLKTLGSFGHCCSPFLLSMAGPRRQPTPNLHKMQRRKPPYKQIRCTFSGNLPFRKSGRCDFRR
jgi:hypothetical protein